MKKIKLNDVIEWPQALGNEGILMDVSDGPSKEVAFELRPELYEKEPVIWRTGYEKKADKCKSLR